ncbi:hypothetical protein SKAU_G00118020 [Synaphobranchus kaupii]|uniref:DDE-1 domain-containing protein n=1 Tax=Synaphobranchus kaupii TaxID=118154 RepID=A0A9Q1FNH4_SYNKA|nr:hypothetical protein SKAU_G00118020 [Synaphobranchus kaupii]
MQEKEFVVFLQHFVSQARATPTNKVLLLLLDNHSPHCSIPEIQYCKEHGIILLTFPPHCSHKLQPLDWSVFGPLKRNVNVAMDAWMRCPQGAKLRDRQARAVRHHCCGANNRGQCCCHSARFSARHTTSNRHCSGTACVCRLEPSRFPFLGSSSCTAGPSTSFQLFSPEALQPYPKAGQRKGVTKGEVTRGVCLGQKPEEAQTHTPCAMRTCKLVTRQKPNTTNNCVSPLIQEQGPVTGVTSGAIHHAFTDQHFRTAGTSQQCLQCPL